MREAAARRRRSASQRREETRSSLEVSVTGERMPRGTVSAMFWRLPGARFGTFCVAGERSRLILGGWQGTERQQHVGTHSRTAGPCRVGGTWQRPGGRARSIVRVRSRERVVSMGGGHREDKQQT